ncbi:MAG: FG-GAP-like repeat-containing protein [Candidatus Methylomirabilales bacterium]
MRIIVVLIWPLLLWWVPSLAQELDFARAAGEVAQKIAAAFPKLQGLIVGVEGDRILVDLGARDGVYEGMELQVFREGDEFRHPITGQPLGKMDKEIGLVRVVEVRDRSSVAQVLRETKNSEEGGGIAKGDLVRIPGARLFLALPNVDPGEVKEANVRSITRDLSTALTKTGRFEVVEDRQLRAALTAEGIEMAALAEPKGLQVLAEKVKARALLLSRLGGEGGMSMDVQVISTLTGRPLVRVQASLQPEAYSRQPSGGRRQRMAQSPIPNPQSPIPSQGLIVGPDFDFALRALAVADFDGDGRKDLAVAGSHRIFLYAFDGRSFRLLWESGVRRDGNILALDGADINGNGRAELFVTNYYDGRLRSYVLEWDGRKMSKVASDLDLFFRVIRSRDGGGELYSQSLGKKVLFEAPIRRYLWSGKRYRQGPPLGVPEGFSLYGIALADLNGDGVLELLAVGEDGLLTVYDLRGRLLHQTGEHLGGSGTIVEFQPARTLFALRIGPSQKIPLPGRIFAVPSQNGSEPEVVVWQNLPASQGGKVLGLRWNGNSFEKLWETRELPGYIADYQLAELGDGGLYLVLLSVKGGRTPRSVLLAHRLY